MSSLRTVLLSSVLGLSVGCSFFSLDDEPVKKMPASPTGGGGGTGGTAAGASGTSTSGSAGTDAAGTGGTSAAGGTGGAGGASGSGTGATAGIGGTAGSPSGGTGGIGESGMGGADDGAKGGMSGTAGSATAGAAGSGPVTCMSQNPGATAFDGHCYLLVTTMVDFTTAKNGCMAMSAHLATISKPEEADRAAFDAENAFVFSKLGGADTWIGLADGQGDKDSPASMPYKWITDEAGPPSDGYGWQDGEPNNYSKNCADNSTCWEHCGFMLPDQGGKWNDDLCENKKQYICEWDQGG